MGAAASIAKAELAKPADGSDVADSVEAARAEVVRLRALIKAQVEESRAEPLDEEAAAGTEVWAYVGTARNAAGTVFGDYNFRRVLFDRGDAEEKASVTMDIEYTPASEVRLGVVRIDCRWVYGCSFTVRYAWVLFVLLAAGFTVVRLHCVHCVRRAGVRRWIP